MSNALDCCNPGCSTVQPTQVPGLEGEAGVDGTNGTNAYTQTTEAIAELPLVGETIPVEVVSAAWMVIGQVVIMGVGVDGGGDGPAHFRVSSFVSETEVNLEFLSVEGDLLPGDPIASGATVSPSAI